MSIYNRLYLVQDDFNPEIPWGGLHITIVGYDASNNDRFDEVKKTNFYKTKWRLHKKTPNGLIVKDKFMMIFESDTLDNFAKELTALEFKNIKGPANNGTRWHITLNDIDDKKAVITSDKLIKSERYWKLVVCSEIKGQGLIWKAL